MSRGERILTSADDAAAEGDVNLSPRRREWEAAHVGASARALLDEDARYFLHQSLSTPCMNALAGASGAWLTDVEGRRYLDFHGNSVHQVGHGHPRVVEAVKRALDTLPFSPRRFTNAYAVALARRLVEAAPGDLNKVLFAPGGAEAIGMALKLARVATGRHKTISMWDAFHGASLDAISIGGEAVFRRDAGPLLPGTEHVQPCDPRACHFGCGGTCNARCADYVEYVLGKGLGCGVFPLAALIAREGLDVAGDRALGHYTHEKSSVGCAAALAALDVIDDEHLCERARRLGERSLARLRAMQQRLPVVGDVRGVGLLLAVELVDPATKAPARDLAERVLYECLANGLSFKVGQGNVLVLSPALVIDEGDLDRALDVVEAAIVACST